MQQEINLYLLLPEQKQPFLTLQSMTISYGILMIMLALHFGLAWWGKHQEVARIEQLKLALQQTGQNLAQIHAQYPMLDPKDMESSLKKLQQELAEKNKVFNLLSANRNFSTELLGTAKAAVPELWLVDIQVEMSEANVTLKGYALHAEAIQRFINNLSLQKEFSGLHFQLQEVTQVSLNKEMLFHFIISSQVSRGTTT